jgi:hypothetical protein
LKFENGKSLFQWKNFTTFGPAKNLLMHQVLQYNISPNIAHDAVVPPVVGSVQRKYKEFETGKLGSI